MGVPAGSCPPGPQPTRDLEHRQLFVEEDDVDRKAHERRVHRPRRPDQHALTPRQVRAPEQAAPTAEEAVGDLAQLADNLTMRANENDRVHRFVEVEAIDCAPVSRRITRTASTNRVVQLPAGPPAWAIGSGAVSGYQSVVAMQGRSAFTKSMGQIESSWIV